MSVVVVIPAYKPGPALLELVRRLSASTLAGIVVVDDGSGPDYEPMFRGTAALPSVVVVRHAVNLGKGAALKTGINHVMCHFREGTGVVTADADGQHLVDDVLKIAAALERNPDALVLGVRGFTGPIPWRSKVGNLLTRLVLRVVAGIDLRDTQTGLRGIPSRLQPGLLKIPAQGYEFELDMLLLSRQAGGAIEQTGITTVYFDDNRFSHFNPLLDSVKIYFALLRFLLTSLMTAIIDYTVFFLSFALGSPAYMSQLVARLVALGFNYIAVRNMVFFSSELHRRTLPRYLLLVCASGFVSYGLLTFLAERFGMPLLAAKAVAESLLFLANFALQRDFIFRREPA